ncbi:DNA sulfur modification protein DndB [Acinetobacter baumannii]
MNESHYSFAALSGVQGRKSNFLIQVPLKVLSKFLKEDDSHLPVVDRSQRVLNKVRVGQIAKYIVENPDSYILPPLVAYIKSGEVKFIKNENTINLGVLKIDIGAEIQLFDGQHRRAAIEEAIKLRKYVGDETIAVMLYSNESIESAQQVFADININATKPAQSIKLLYNHRDQINQETRKLIELVPFFKQYVDYERTNLSSKSECIFTFSGIYQLVKTMLTELGDGVDTKQISSFWIAVSEVIEQWVQLNMKLIEPEKLRANYVHAHSVIWLALANLGCYLFKNHPTDWKKYVEKLKDLNWSRTDHQWQGRCVILGRISKSRQSVILSENVIYRNIGIALPSVNQNFEDKFNLGN